MKKENENKEAALFDRKTFCRIYFSAEVVELLGLLVLLLILADTMLGLCLSMSTSTFKSRRQRRDNFAMLMAANLRKIAV